MIDAISAGGDRRSKACFSAIIYGPPGSSKTTIARRVASDLKWPLIELGMRDFLSDGLEQIENRADQIFGLLYLVRDVVVLFDELEELIRAREIGGDRNARLATTAMLPRLQKLRDSQRVVFIFATNYIEKIDMAILRTGRFDIIKYLPLPTTAEKAEALKSHAERIFKARSASTLGRELQVRSADPAWIERCTNYMSYGDVKYMIGRLERMEEADGLVSSAEVDLVFNDFAPLPGLTEMVADCAGREIFDRPRRPSRS